MMQMIAAMIQLIAPLIYNQITRLSGFICKEEYQLFGRGGREGGKKRGGKEGGKEGRLPNCTMAWMADWNLKQYAHQWTINFGWQSMINEKPAVFPVESRILLFIFILIYSLTSFLIIYIIVCLLSCIFI